MNNTFIFIHNVHAFPILISPFKSFYSLLHADKNKLSMNSFHIHMDIGYRDLDGKKIKL